MTALCFLRPLRLAGNQNNTDTQCSIVLGALKCETISPGLQNIPHTQTRNGNEYEFVPKPHKMFQIVRKSFRIRFIHIHSYHSFTIFQLWYFWQAVCILQGNSKSFRAMISCGNQFKRSKVILKFDAQTRSNLLINIQHKWRIRRVASRLIGDECKWGKFIGPQASVIIHVRSLSCNDDWENI